MPNNDWDILSNFNKCLINNGDGTFSVRFSGSASAIAVGASVTGGGANRVLYEDSSQLLAASANLTFDGTTLSIGANTTIASDGSTVFNDLGNAVNFRIESDTNANMFFLDGTNNKIIIGSNTGSGFTAGSFNVVTTDATISLQATSASQWAGFNLYDQTGNLTFSHQVGNSGASGFTRQGVFAARATDIPIIFYSCTSAPSTFVEHFRCGAAGAGTIFNEQGIDLDERHEGDTDQNLLVLDAGTDTFNVGTATPANNTKATFQTSASGNFSNVITMLAPNVTTSGFKMCFNLGQADSAKNLASFAFKYVGAGSTSNAFEVYFHSDPNPVVSFEQNTGILTAGKFTQYNSIATISNGVPSELATVDLTAQSAAIGATTIYAVPASGVGMYRVSWVADITTAATTSSVLGGAAGFQVRFTSPTDSVVKTDSPTNINSSATNTTGTSVSGVEVVYCKASTNLQYLFGYTSVGVTAMVYELHIKVEAL